MVKIGDICTIKASDHPADPERNWLLNLDVVEQQTGKVLEYRYVSETELDGSIVAFDTNNVLYSKLRPNLNKVIVPQFEGYATSELLPLFPNTTKITREYLALYLRSTAFVNWAVSKTAGAKMPRLGTKELLGKEIPLPQIDEQRRITAELDKVDNLISLRKKQLQKLDDLIKSRFVVLMEKADLGEETTIDSITERVKVGFVGTCEKHYTDESGIPMLRTGNITEKGIDLSDLKYVTAEFHNKNKKSQIHTGDLLIARHGSNGQANVYYGPEAQCLNAVVIVPNQKIASSVFLAGLINSPAVKRQIEQTLVGSTQHVVNTKSIAGLTVRIPDVAIQIEYESFVAEVDKSRLTIQQGLDKLEQMKQALMQKYFGEY